MCWEFALSLSRNATAKTVFGWEKGLSLRPIIQFSSSKHMYSMFPLYCFGTWQKLAQNSPSFKRASFSFLRSCDTDSRLKPRTYYIENWYENYVGSAPPHPPYQWLLLSKASLLSAHSDSVRFRKVRESNISGFHICVAVLRARASRGCVCGLRSSLFRYKLKRES